MTLHDVANYLNCHYTTFWRIVQRGELPAFRLGGDFRVRRIDLEKWLADQHVPAGESKLTGKGRDKRES
jgi:excisionase family DNA binding protein